MKRSEFAEITEWWELKDACDEVGCDALDNLVDGESRDTDINDRLVDMARNNCWTDLRDILNDYWDESGYDYYEYDEYYDTYRGVSDDDFDDYKRQVRDYIDENDEWDEEDPIEEGGEEETVFSEDNSVPVPSEDCSFSDMFDESMSCIGQIVAGDGMATV